MTGPCTTAKLRLITDPSSRRLLVRPTLTILVFTIDKVTLIDVAISKLANYQNAVIYFIKMSIAFIRLFIH